MIDELKRNGEGYNDPTAYKALTNYEKVESKMKSRKGEIWTAATQSGNKNEIIILADHDNYVTALALYDENRSASDYAILSKTMKYTDLGRISYYFDDRLEDYVKTVTDAEFDALMESVGESLGINKRHIEPLIASQRSIEQILPPNVHDPEVEVLKAKIGIYKDLYEQLLAKITA